MAYRAFYLILFYMEWEQSVGCCGRMLTIKEKPEVQVEGK